jgi:hypothetical protein
MRRLLLPVLGAAALTIPGHAQTAISKSDLEAKFSFEAEPRGTTPTGWGGGPAGTIAVDGETVHGGRWSVRLERDERSPNGFSTITTALPMDFAGKTIEWRGFLRTENVSEYVGLWMREDGDIPSLAFDNMQQRQVNGTRDWTEYSISLPLHPDAKQLVFGVLVTGTGKVWADDLQLLVDGKPVWDAPKIERPKTPIDLDHQFDRGSGVVLSDLTAPQIANLALLGKVWGFLKYHHQSVVAGKYHWDYELLRVLPTVLAARDRDAGKAAVTTWVRSLGEIPACGTCLTRRTPTCTSVRPGLIDQEEVVGRDLAGCCARSAVSGLTASSSTSQVPNVRNPKFDPEPAYATLNFPDAGYQLLALPILEHRQLLVLTATCWIRLGPGAREFIPNRARQNEGCAQLEFIALIAKVTDTHANLWSAPPQIRPPAGACQLPVTTRFIEDRAVVTGYSDAASGPATGLKIGDVIESLDGVPVEELVERWAPYYPASNQPARLRDSTSAAARMTEPIAPIRKPRRVRADNAASTTAGVPIAARCAMKLRFPNVPPGARFRLKYSVVAPAYV